MRSVLSCMGWAERGQCRSNSWGQCLHQIQVLVGHGSDRRCLVASVTSLRGARGQKNLNLNP